MKICFLIGEAIGILFIIIVPAVVLTRLAEQKLQVQMMIVEDNYGAKYEKIIVEGNVFYRKLNTHDIFPVTSCKCQCSNWQVQDEEKSEEEVKWCK